MSRVLVTGGAGFIGSHLVESLLADGHEVVVLDNFDPFYDEAIKRSNLEKSTESPAFRLVKASVEAPETWREDVEGTPDVIVHLAAKAGVRPSIEDPDGYRRANVEATLALLEFAKERGVPQFVFASSSSVYGVNPRVPWSEEDHDLMPISPYAWTKLSGEQLGHVYSHLTGMRFVALRFFTVFGPRQRPDLAIHKFARLIDAGERLPFFGDGSTRRDYTFVKDILAGIKGAIAYDKTPFEIINLGNNQTVTLSEMVSGLEEALGKKALLEHLPAQPGDVPQTWASVEKAGRLLGYRPTTPFRAGLEPFVAWMREQRTGS